MYGTPGGIRTPDLRYRKPTLYPAKLRVHAMRLTTILNIADNREGDNRKPGNARQCPKFYSRSAG